MKTSHTWNYERTQKFHRTLMIPPHILKISLESDRMFNRRRKEILKTVKNYYQVNLSYSTPGSSQLFNLTTDPSNYVGKQLIIFSIIVNPIWPSTKHNYLNMKGLD